MKNILIIALIGISGCAMPKQTLDNGRIYSPPTSFKYNNNVYSKVSPKSIPHLVYPVEADPCKIGGKVVVKIQVDKSGTPVKVISIQGDQVFFKYAKEYVMNWKFYPAIWNGEAQSAVFTATVDFRKPDPRDLPVVF